MALQFPALILIEVFREMVPGGGDTITDLEATIECYFCDSRAMALESSSIVSRLIFVS